MAPRRGFRAARLARRVDKNMTAAVQLMQSGQATVAIHHNEEAIGDVVKLMKLEPDDLEHRRMLGSLHYNGAAIFEQLGRLDAAVSDARFALSAYQMLPGGGLAPSDIPVLGLLTVRGAFAPLALDPQESMDVIAMVADVKARLGRLLARASGAKAADEVHELGRSAIAAYERLAEAHPERTGGLARVRTQYEEAKRALAA